MSVIAIYRSAGQYNKVIQIVISVMLWHNYVVVFAEASSEDSEEESEEEEEEEYVTSFLKYYKTHVKIYYLF